MYSNVMRKLLPLLFVVGCGGSGPSPIVEPPFIDTFPGTYDGTFFMPTLNESGTITMSVTGGSYTATVKNDTLKKTATVTGKYFLHPTQEKWRMVEATWVYKGSAKKQPFDCTFVMLGNGGVQGYCALDDGDVHKSRIVGSPVEVSLTKR